MTGLRLLRGWGRVLGAGRLLRLVLLPGLLLLTGLAPRLLRLGVVRLVRRLWGPVLRTRLLLPLVRRTGATGGSRRRRGRRRCRCGRLPEQRVGPVIAGLGWPVVSLALRAEALVTAVGGCRRACFGPVARHRRCLRRTGERVGALRRRRRHRWRRRGRGGLRKRVRSGLVPLRAVAEGRLRLVRWRTVPGRWALRGLVLVLSQR